jgi:NAD(P)-dependent dehydrogenase (short-subunit alcohol dehydrogenase family)
LEKELPLPLWQFLSGARGFYMDQIPVVIVTGASRGIGAYVARWLGKAGAAVALVARSGDKLKQVALDVKRLGGAPLPMVADVADPGACSGVVEETVGEFGRIDALVNNAGMVDPLAFVAMADTESWRYAIEVNLLGPFYMARASILELRNNRGRVVNVSSGAATTPIQAASAYCAAKAGLNHFTRVLAAEEPSVVCVTMRPGVVDTDMQAVIRQVGPAAMPPDQFAYYQGLKDEGKLEPPWVPARSIAWLALHAPLEWSGHFLNYDDPNISRPALEVFGEGLEEAP